MPENSSTKNSKKFIPEEERTRPALDLSRTVVKGIFTNRSRPWDAIPCLANYVRDHGDELSYEEFDEISENVWVHVSAYLAPTAKIEAPAIICGGARISQHSYIEGSVIGSFATVGEMAAVKNSVLFDKSKLSGHNSVCSSVLGYESTLGIGCMIPDSRLDGMNITFDMPEGTYLSGRTRLGAIICDGVKVGAGCVITPGTVIDVGSKILPMHSVTGYVYPYTTVK